MWGKTFQGVFSYCSTYLSILHTEIMPKLHMRHSKCHGYQCLETAVGDNAISRFKNFQNSLLQRDKVALDCEEKLRDVSDTTKLNRIKELETIVVIYDHAQRETFNVNQLVEVVDTLGGEDCMCTTMSAVVKTKSHSISRLCNVNYPMTLSSEDKLVIKNNDMRLVCKRILLRVLRKG